MLIIIISSLLVGILFAPLGCALLWQRMSYFSDGLAHACLLASGITAAMSLSILITAPVVAIIFAILVFAVGDREGGGSAINIASSTMLSFGLLLASIFPSSINLMGLLLGDILATNTEDILVLCLLCLVTFVFFWVNLRDIVVASLSTDLAESRGIKTKRLELLFLVLMAVVLSICMKMIGAILSSALLIIPAAASHLLSKNPGQMILLSIIVSMISSGSGLVVSFYLDLPTAPCIIICCSVMYLVARVYRG